LALIDAVNALDARRQKTSNPQEIQAIDDATPEINIRVDVLHQAGPLQAAAAVSDAVGEFLKVINAARPDPLAGAMSDLRGAIGKLSQGPDSAASATDAAATSTSAGTPAATATAAPVGGFTPIDSQDFGQLRQEYQSFFDASTPRAEFSGDIAFCVNRLRRGQSRYQSVASDLGIPWQFIGIIHGLEGSFDFTTHLHNGDPLTARTVHVPAGRPAAGDPPFTWEQSAKDALLLHGFGGQDDWSLPRMLFRWERFNGFGYRPLSIPSPYLWCFSNLYSKGKFVADGQFDPNFVSRQCGAAVMLKAIGL
jgi:lysozyme family protein